MELKSFDTILMELCDIFDGLISPQKITRNNTNIIYLIFKAISKGFEVINNTCVLLSRKFNPALCDSGDLESLSKIVGTERFLGSGSGLYITCINTSSSNKTLNTGVYKYFLSEDVEFVFEISDPITLQPQGIKTFIAMTSTIGTFPVTKQERIDVSTDAYLAPEIVFSCDANDGLLGTPPENDLEFRERLLSGYNNQNSIIELQTTLKNLPYFFDVALKFNSTTGTITSGNVSIPPYNLAIFYSGSPRKEVGEILLNKIICPTVETNNSYKIRVASPVFVGGEYTFNLIPFSAISFDIKLVCKFDNSIQGVQESKNEITEKLMRKFRIEKHIDIIKESDVYNVLKEVYATGLTVLEVRFLRNGIITPFINIAESSYPRLESVEFVTGD